ncbi:MAG: glycosyltransferase family 39 protein [Anaerolineae bacterium]
MPSASVRMGRLGAAAALAGALLAAVGQRLVDAGTVTTGVVLLIVGGGVFAASSPRDMPGGGQGALRASSSGPRSWWPVLAAYGLGLAGVSAFAANRVTWWAGTAWLLGLALLAWAAWPDEGVTLRRDCLSSDGVRLTWHGVVLLGIVLLGCVFRFYRLRELPAEMGCDLPLIQANIAQILQGDYAVFFPSWPGREGLFFYLAALPARILGLSHWTIKAVSAALGLATLPAIYLLGREVHSREAGLYAAGMLAVSHWHVILTRMGYRLSAMPLLVALALWAWLQARRTGGRHWYALCGLLVGLGLHSYNAFMIAPAWIALLVVGEGLRDRAAWPRERLKGLLLLLVVMLYVALPLDVFAVANPDVYLFRVATRLTGEEVALSGHPLLVLAQNAWRAAGMFNVRGDSIATSNVPGLRQLGYLPALLLPLGLGWTLLRWRRDGHMAVLVTLPTMLAPTALSLAFPREVPNAGRAVGALIPALTLSAMALAELRRTASRALGGLAAPSKLALAGPVALVLTLFGGETVSAWETYFGAYREHLPAGNYSISREMARAIDAFAHEGPVYTVIWPHHYDGNAVRAQLERGSLPVEHELPSLVAGEPPLDDGPGKRMVILAPEDTVSLAILERAFPRGVAVTHVDDEGREKFVTFYGER